MAETETENYIVNSPPTPTTSTSTREHTDGGCGWTNPSHTAEAHRPVVGGGA